MTDVESPMMLTDVRIGFERPGDSVISRLIAGHDSPGLFSHAAIVFDRDIVCESHAKYGGVRFKRYVPDPARWVFVRPRLLAGEPEMIRTFLELESGDGYDMGGVLSIGRVPFAKPDPEKWFCSELVCAALAVVGLFKDLTPHLTSPNGLYLACERAGLVLN